MRYQILKYSYKQLEQLLIGNIVNFKSDCQFFPNFDVTGKVESMSYASNAEIIFKVRCKSKLISIGSNMHNLTFELVNSSIH